MDEIDRKLLSLLQEDATLAMAQLADQVGLSATPVWKRVQKLEAAGVITRRVALDLPVRPAGRAGVGGVTSRRAPRAEMPLPNRFLDLGGLA